MARPKYIQAKDMVSNTPLGVELILRNKLMDYLYSATVRYQHEQLTNIIQKNDSEYENVQNCMHFQGKHYTCGERIDKEGPVNNLHRNIRNEFKEWLSMCKTTEREKIKITDFFMRLLIVAKSYQDLELILPDALHPMLYEVEEALTARDEGPLGPTQLAFVKTNQSALDAIKMRLTKNLIGAGI